MHLIDNKGITDPRLNLALEEYCLRHLDPENEYLLFYINEPSVIVGKHQIPLREADCEYARKKGIRILRRISGGGAVYHDYGNLNFSFITDFQKQKLNYFKKLIQPIVDSLIRLGASAKITENNNIVVGDYKYKVSGTSQYTNMKRMLSHGTLLFDSALDVLNSVLVSNSKVIQFKGIESIHSQVTNISDHVSQAMNMTTFLQELISGYSDSLGELETYQLTPENWNSVCRLSEEKYKTWDWTYGRSPDFTIGQIFKHDATEVCAHIKVSKGIIRNIEIVGEHSDSAVIEKKFKILVGERYHSEFNDP